MINSKTFYIYVAKAFLILCLVGFCTTDLFGKILLAETGKEQYILLNDLRRKTGLKNISVDRFNYLESSNELVNGGSVTMRRLIRKAINDPDNIFVIHDHSDSKGIHFCNTDEGTVDMVDGSVRYAINFDFSDLNTARRFSSKSAIESFSHAIILFHEIDHKVSYANDEPIPLSGVRPDYSIGELVGVIPRTNVVRRELGLPERVETLPLIRRYRGLIAQFRNTFQIPFTGKNGETVFVRFKT